jgi:hypothetical protein
MHLLDKKIWSLKIQLEVSSSFQVTVCYDQKICYLDKNLKDAEWQLTDMDLTNFDYESKKSS